MRTLKGLVGEVLNYTLCPRNLNPFYSVTLLYKMGQDSFVVTFLQKKIYSGFKISYFSYGVGLFPAIFSKVESD